MLAEQGHTVLGVDPSKERVTSLSQGELPFFEPGLSALLVSALSSGRLTFTTDYDKRLMSKDVHFLCVGTPDSGLNGEVDLSAVFSSGESLASFLKQESVIVGRSTVPVGTAASLRGRIAKAAGHSKFSLAWNPEFLSEGMAVSQSRKPDRIVIGVSDEKSIEVLKSLYEPQIDSGAPLIVMDIPSSELVKVASNSFLAMKISFINGVAEIAEKSGASTARLAEAMGLDPRIGRRFISNGLGFGGGCLPKDLAGFANTAKKLENDSFAKLLTAAEQINQGRISKTIQLAKDNLGILQGKRISILGITFKPHTDDVRESPGLKLAAEFNALGSTVSIHDPVAAENAASEIGIKVSRDVNDVMADADLVVVATDWPEYANIEPELRSLEVGSVVIDGRSIISTSSWVEAGWKVIRLGEGHQFQPSALNLI
jgi:UDPglucose 6-dehydrogenase